MDNSVSIKQVEDSRSKQEAGREHKLELFTLVLLERDSQCDIVCGMGESTFSQNSSGVIHINTEYTSSG